MQDLEQNTGGVEPKYDVSNIGGVQANMTNSDRGREEIKNHENLADVICTRPQKAFLMTKAVISSNLTVPK